MGISLKPWSLRLPSLRSERSPGKAVVGWEESTGKTGQFGILALSLTRPEQGQVFSLFLGFDFLPCKTDRIKTIIWLF